MEIRFATRRWQTTSLATLHRSLVGVVSFLRSTLLPTLVGVYLAGFSVGSSVSVGAQASTSSTMGAVAIVDAASRLSRSFIGHASNRFRSTFSVLHHKSSNQPLQPTAGRSDVQLSDDFNIKLHSKARSHQRWLSSFSLGLRCVTI